MMNTPVYNFIVPEHPDHALSDLQEGSLRDFWRLYCQGEYAWSLQTYHALKSIGLSVRLSYELDPEVINLAHGKVLQVLPKRHDCYCVSLQADYPHYPLAQYHVVQNQTQFHADRAYVPHWPQIGQIPRDSSRNGVITVAYQGDANFTELNPEKINTDLAGENIRFELLDETRWQDLGDVDVLVGIRRFGKREYKRKPPSKLINAWHAGIPFIGGWDSAYSQIGTPGEDYLRVSNCEEMIGQIIQLKKDMTFYQSLVDAGARRAKEYDFSTVTARWVSLLTGDVACDYRFWKEGEGKAVSYRLKLGRYALSAAVKQGLRGFYRFEGIKRLRDLYYDPVK